MTAENQIVLVKFLTPVKICTLILIQHYFTEADQDIPVLERLQFLHLLSVLIDTPAARTVSDLRVRLDDIAELVEKYTNDEDLYRYLVKVLGTLTSIEPLYDFFRELNDLTAPGNGDDNVEVLSEDSVCGGFVKKCKSSFDNLAFDEIIKLVEYLKAFNTGKGLILGTNDLESLESLEGIEKYGSVDGDVKYVNGNRMNYLIYLQAIKQKDYEKSVEYLHKFHDYSNNPKYQYALVNLALVQNEELALDEAIHVARENKDFGCLNYILAYKNENRFKSKETSYSLYSLAYLDQVKHDTNMHSLTLAFESLWKSFFINAASNTDNFNTNLTASTLWTRLGISSLANLSLDIIEPTKRDSLIENEVKLRRAKLLYLEGNLEKCFDILYELRDDPNIPYREQWWPKVLLIYLREKINAEKLKEVKLLILRIERLLENLEKEGKKDENDIKELEYLQLLYEQKIGNTSKVMQRIWQLLEQEQEDALFQVRLMTFYARLLTHSGHSQRATSIVLKIIKLSQINGFFFYMYVGVVMFAQISYVQKDYEGAISLIDGVMPRVYETNNALLIGRAYRILADSTVRIFEQDSTTTSQPSYDYLDRATEYYQRSGKCK